MRCLAAPRRCGVAGTPARGSQRLQQRVPFRGSRVAVARAAQENGSSSTNGAGGSDGSSDGGQTRRAFIAATVAATAAAAAAATGPGAAVAAGQCELQADAAGTGLQWCDIAVGDGASPARGALIRAHYTGRLASNGRVFDSSYERGRPLNFKIGAGEVIRGWDLGVLGTGGDGGLPAMREGGKRLLVIPAALAYGDRGAGGGLIPPGADLEFVVELLPKRR